METKNPNIEQKQIFFKVYQNLLQLENAIQIIKEKDSNSKLQISILVKITKNNSTKEKISKATIDVMKMDCEKILGDTVAFGSFYDSNIGEVFIVGALAPIFLYKIGGKVLAEMSTGIYGVLRGLGASRIDTEVFLKHINTRSCILIMRGYDYDFELVEDVLIK